MKEKSLAYISIVSIVAIVAIVIMVMNYGARPASTMLDENVAGQAWWWVEDEPDTPGNIESTPTETPGSSDIIIIEDYMCRYKMTFDYYAAGELKYVNDPIIGEFYLYDTCLDKTRLREYYCNSGEQLKSKIHDCKYDCKNNACMRWEDMMEVKKCIDTDMYNEEPIYEKGTVTIKGEVYKEDVCFLLDENNMMTENIEGEYLTEYSCTTEDKLFYTRHKCPAGCINGACMAGDGEGEGCVESDGGDNRLEYGTVSVDGEVYSSDICFNLDEDLNIIPGESGEYVTEYYCGASGVEFTRFKCEYGCSAGACLGEDGASEADETSEPGAVSCVDTDGGSDSYTKGTITGTIPDFGEYERTDMCWGNDEVLEYSCTKEYWLGPENLYLDYISEHIACPNGCEDDACI